MLLAFNDDLAHRCFDVLEDWLERADQLLLVDPESPRLRKFRRMCDDAWNRLTKARDVDVKPDHGTPAPHTTAGQFALGSPNTAPASPTPPTWTTRCGQPSPTPATEPADRGTQRRRGSLPRC